MRGAHTRPRHGGDLLASKRSLEIPSRARVRRKVPGLFVFYAPLAESEYAHASEACFSGFESRVGYQIFRASECARACSFTTWMWQRCPAARNVPSESHGPRGGDGGLAPARSRHSSSGKSVTPPASRCEFEPRCLFHRSRRLTVRTAAFQAANAGSTPAGNAIGDVAQSTERSPCKRRMRV